MRAQQVDELRRGEALMPDFHRMPDRGDILRPGPRPSLQPRVMATRERRCGVTVFWQQFQECAKPLGVETHIGRELPEDRPQLRAQRSEEHTSELQSLMRNSYAVFCLKKKKTKQL